MATPQKRDTRLKHRTNRVNEPEPVFRNLEEVVTSTRLTKDHINEIMVIVGNYLTEKLPNQRHLRSAAEIEAVSPLIQLVAARHKDLWDGYDECFMTRTIQFLIGRKLLNLRRKRGRGDETTDEDDSEVKGSQTKQRSTSAYTSHRSETPYSLSSASVASTEPADYSIRARLQIDNRNTMLSYASVSDLLPGILDPSRTTISQVDFDRWTDILRIDVRWTSLHTITYAFAEGAMPISDTRYLKAAITDARSRGMECAMFIIQSPELGESKSLSCIEVDRIHVNSICRREFAASTPTRQKESTPPGHTRGFR